MFASFVSMPRDFCCTSNDISKHVAVWCDIIEGFLFPFIAFYLALLFCWEGYI